MKPSQLKKHKTRPSTKSSPDPPAVTPDDFDDYSSHTNHSTSTPRKQLYQGQIYTPYPQDPIVQSTFGEVHTEPSQNEDDVSEIPTPHTNRHNETPTPSTFKGVVKDLPGLSFLNTTPISMYSNDNNISLPWEKIEETQPNTLYDIFTGPFFECTPEELHYVDKFRLSILHNIDNMDMSWTIGHTHHTVLKDKYFKLFLFKIFKLTSLPADLDHQLQFLQNYQHYFQPEQVCQYQKQLKPLMNSNIVIPIRDRMASLAMPVTTRDKEGTNSSNSNSNSRSSEQSITSSEDAAKPATTQTPQNLQDKLEVNPRKIKKISRETLDKLDLSEIEKEQILQVNAHSRMIYKKDWKSHKFTGSINWKPGDYANFPTMKNTIEGHYLQTSMRYIFMNDFISLYARNGPDVYKINEHQLNGRDVQNIIEDATSLYGCLLGLVRKNKYQILSKFEHSPFGNNNDPNSKYPDFRDGIKAWKAFTEHFDKMGNKEVYIHSLSNIINKPYKYHPEGIIGWIHEK